MIYEQQEPSDSLTEFVKSFWLVDSENDKSIKKEKIIPDGYPEMIFHYKDPYKSNIKGYWRDQRDTCIIAGQIRNFFYLENTGYTGMFAIKFQPWAFKELFDIDMTTLTDEAVTIPEHILNKINSLKSIALSKKSFTEKVQECEQWLLKFISTFKQTNQLGKLATKSILLKKGRVTIEELQSETGISERSLERYFKTYIGLSPKFYTRIIRFSYIFKLITNDNPNWTEVSTETGYYDQSHFIKNFKEFTGEEPNSYGFSDVNMAHLFLKS